MGPAGPGGGGSGPWEKNPVSKRVDFGLQAKTRGSGPDMEKPDPLPFLLKSVTLANATHRELGKVADGTSTQVRV